MDLSTIVYIVGALAYALLRQLAKPKPVPRPSPGPVVFQPSKAPLPLPSAPLPAPPITNPRLTPHSKSAPIIMSHAQPSILTESKLSSEPNAQPETNPFPRPDRNEWRRAIVLSTLLEPRYDRGLYQ
ncbi:MAG: hypothetical protein FJ350_01440 [Sphingomonadales bacterium]|nr:hypothetical protein [Sphingomonadales bacterium]MBM3923249.1 hypothetical protein [Sphingomonadales bacterium]